MYEVQSVTGGKKKISHRDLLLLLGLKQSPAVTDTTLSGKEEQEGLSEVGTVNKMVYL